MSDHSPSLPHSTNAATGVDKAMKQFSQTDAERERPPVEAREEKEDKDRPEADAPSATQPPRSDAPADAPATPQR